MAFNAESFAKSVLKSPVQKMVDSVVGKVTAGLPSGTKSLATSLSESLFNIGASYDSVQSMASLKTDSAVLRNAGDYVALAGKLTDHSSGVDVASKRSSATGTVFNSVNPNIKIASKQQQYEAVVLAIV